MPPIPPDIVRVSFVWKAAEEIAVNTLHVHVSGPTNDWGEMTQRVANAARAAITAEWPTLSACHGDIAQVDRVDAYHLSAETGKTIDKRTAVVTPGVLKGASGSVLPFEVAAVVSLYGYDPAIYDPLGARKRGRIYLPFISGSSLGQTGRFTRWQAARDGWRGVVNRIRTADVDAFGETPLGDIELLPVVLSRRWAEQNRIRAVISDDLFDVQRRRQGALISGRPHVLTAD